MREFIFCILTIFGVAALSSAEENSVFEPWSDGQGGCVYRWEKERVAFTLDENHTGRPEITNYFWGDRVYQTTVDANRGGRQELMATFSPEGIATWYEKKNELNYFPLMKLEGTAYTAAKDLLKASIVRRVAIDDGSLPLTQNNSCENSPFITEPSGQTVAMTLVLFPAPEISAKTGNPEEKPIPISLPQMDIPTGKNTFLGFPNLSIQKNPFDDTITARASVKLAIHPYDVLEPSPPQEAEPIVVHRIQLCIRIIVEGERDDRFCMDDLFQPGSPLFANAPSTDLTGRTHGSWVIEIHRTPVK